MWRGLTVMLAGALVVGCTEVTVPSSSPVGCVWQAQEPVTLAARETQSLSLVVSRDGARVALIHADADATWVTRWAWGNEIANPRMLSEHAAFLVARGPADEGAVLVFDDAGQVLLVEENGVTTALELTLDRWWPRALGPVDRSGGRTLLLGRDDRYPHLKTLRIQGGNVFSKGIGCYFGPADLLIRDDSLAAIPAWAPLAVCDDPQGSADRMIQVVSLFDGHDVRHVVPRRDVPFLHLESLQLIEHGDGLSLVWQDGAACGRYCFGEPNDRVFWIQPLDREGRASGPQQQLSFGAWLLAVAGVGNDLAVLERGDPDQIHFIDRTGTVQRSMPTDGNVLDAEYEQANPAALAGSPRGDMLVTAWTRGGGEVVVQTFVCTD